MGDPNGPALDALGLIEVLDRHNVEYVLVGGLAAVVYGATRLTTDIDVVPKWDGDNHTKLAAALKELHAGLRVPDSDTAVAFPLDVHTFRSFEISTWRTDLGDLDVIIGIPTMKRGQLRGYAELAANGASYDIGGSIVVVGSLDDIVESKTALGRPTDLVALEELRQLQQQRNSELDTQTISELSDPGDFELGL
jgi:hypothetical protein